MPDFYVLRFADGTPNPPTLPEMPDPATVGHAAAWAAERGYWDVATCLMELAHALANLEHPVTAAGPMTSIGLAKMIQNGVEELSPPGPVCVCNHPTGGVEFCPIHNAAKLDSWLMRAVDARRMQLDSWPQLDGMPGDAQRCEHGYFASHNVHIGTGGICDLSAGTGV